MKECFYRKTIQYEPRLFRRAQHSFVEAHSVHSTVRRRSNILRSESIRSKVSLNKTHKKINIGNRTAVIAFFFVKIDYNCKVDFQREQHMHVSWKKLHLSDCCWLWLFCLRCFFSGMLKIRPNFQAYGLKLKHQIKRLIRFSLQ